MGTRIKLALVLILLFSFKIKAAEIKGSGSSSSSTSIDFSSVATRSDVANATSTVINFSSIATRSDVASATSAITSGVSTTTIAGTTFTFIAPITISNNITISTGDGIAAFVIPYTSASATNISSISVSIPLVNDVNIMFTSSGVGNTSAGLCMWFNDDQSTSYAVGRLINGSNTTSSAVSSATLTGTMDVFPNFINVILTDNLSGGYHKVLSYSGGWTPTNPTTAPTILYGMVTYRNFSPITKISFGCYTVSGPTGPQNIKGPMKLSIKCISKP